MKISTTASSTTLSSFTRRRLAPTFLATSAPLESSSAKPRRPNVPFLPSSRLSSRSRASKTAMTSPRPLPAPNSRKSTWTSSGRPSSPSNRFSRTLVSIGGRRRCKSSVYLSSYYFPTNLRRLLDRSCRWFHPYPEGPTAPQGVLGGKEPSKGINPDEAAA